MATAPGLNEADRFSEPQAGLDDGIHVFPPDRVSDPAFEAAWTALSRTAAEPNPFFEPWLLMPAITHFVRGERVELLAYVAHGELCGLMPIARSQSYYGYPLPHCSVWQHANAFCGTPLVKCGHEQAYWQALFSAFDKDPRGSLFLHLPLMAADGPVATALNTLLNTQRRTNGVVSSLERAMLQSELSSQDYLNQSLSQKRRKELRRLRRRLSEEGELVFERFDDASDLEQWTQEFLELERISWKGKEGSALASAPETNGFFIDTLAEAARAGSLERLAFRLAERPIAMLINLVTPPAVFSFKTTFDEAFSKYSPGFLLQLDNLALLDRDDIQWADSCAAEGHPMIERLWREKRTIESRNIAIGGQLRRGLFKQLMRHETRQRKDT